MHLRRDDDLVEERLHGLCHERLQDRAGDRQRYARHGSDRARPAGGGAEDDTAGDVALVRLDAAHLAVLDVEARHLDALVDLGAAAARLLGVPPDDGVVPDDPTGRVVERALDRPRHVLADVNLGAELLHFLPVDHAAVDAEQLVHLGALVLHDERAVGVRQREVPVLREHHVEVEIDGELLVELDALRVERGPLGGAVVRADDRRVAPGRSRPDVALLEDRDVGDAVVDREVVRRREAVRATAHDDDVVMLLQRPGSLQDLLAEEDVLHAAPPPRASTPTASIPTAPPPRAPARSTATSHT